MEFARILYVRSLLSNHSSDEILVMDLTIGANINLLDPKALDLETLYRNGYGSGDGADGRNGSGNDGENGVENLGFSRS
ncbi:hypothetical protein AHAS_Ahas05G0278400 [Arachis hypogaea]